MNQEIKEKWVAALRSGDYKQGKYALHSVENGTYCCLGVLCEIAVAEGAALEHPALTSPDKVAYIGVSDFGAGSYSLLPTGVKEWAGLDARSPEVPNGDEDGYTMVHLTSLNDEGIPFSEIADLIEQHL